METRCDACVLWSKPARFRRVCPLLVQTHDGLRCSADTPAVRPFWGRALGFYGGAAATLYGVAAIGFFIFLRTVGYPVSIFQVALPPLWDEVGQARGTFFYNKSIRAFEEGRPIEGLLYLENAYQFDPGNYVAGISLAKHLQAVRPLQSDEVFRRLLRDHEDKRAATAQDWFRALIARGSFERIAELAGEQVLVDEAHAPVWMRALLFATLQIGDDTALRTVQATAGAEAWQPLIETELLRRDGRTAAARRAIEQPLPESLPKTVRAFTIFHRVRSLLAQGDTYAALDLLLASSQMLDAEARVTLELDAFAIGKSEKLHRRRVDELLAPRITPANLWMIKTLCAHLIRHPDPQTFARLYDKVERENLALHADTAGIWFSLLCTAGAVGDYSRLHQLTMQLKDASRTPFVALNAVEMFFRGATAERRIAPFLTFLPLPLEVTYALYERYAPPPPRAVPEAERPKRR